MKINFKTTLIISLATFQIASAAENPFKSFEGNYQVTSEQCFYEIYLHPAECRPSLTGVNVTFSDEGEATVTENFGNNNSSPIDLKEAQEFEDPSHTISATVSGTFQPRSAIWQFRENYRQDGLRQSLNTDISFKEDRNETQFMDRRGISKDPSQSEQIFLRAAVLKKIPN
jgi:hypothetical protein